jgi:hypothetical protein
MSDHTAKVPLKDLAKKRRRYIVARFGTRAAGCAGAAIAVIFGVTTIIVLLSIVAWDGRSDAVNTMREMCAALLTAGVTCLGIKAAQDANDRIFRMPYVPPAGEQVAALPAVEVLLRSSDEPAAAPEELLRAAQAKIEQRANQLLRSTCGTE